MWNLDCVEARLPVVILSPPEPAPRGQVVDVAPVWIDVENATPWDLLLPASDTTTSQPWRIVFGCQTLVYQRFLAAPFGVLGACAMTALHAALRGVISAERRGPAWESDHDPRLTGDHWMHALIARCAVSPDDF